MKKNKDDLEIFYDTLMAGISIGEKDSAFPDAFYKAFRGGKTKLIQKNIEESSKVDDEWIKVIETYIPSLNKIVNDYKVQLRVEREIVNIERAKKINSESVRQLAQNTHQIKEVRAGNKVVPKKILTSHSDIDSGLYENRFIMTLIDRLFHFVRHRYDKIKDVLFHAKLRHLSFESTFPLDDLDVDINFDLKLKEKGGTNQLNMQNHALFERIEYIQKVMNFLYNSQFQREISKLKKVHPPIIKTQILLKNTDYQNAYLLWLYLDKIHNDGYVSSDFKENNLEIDIPYQEDLSRIALVGFSTVLQNQIDRYDIYEQLKSRKYRRQKVEVNKDKLTQEYEGDYGKQTLELNEAFLDQLKAHFQESINVHSQNTKTYETALKRALRDMINISNTLYESFFKLGGESSVYERMLLQEKDEETKIKEAKARIQIARMIRETKAVDYNQAIRLEKKWIKQVENADKALINESKKKLNQTKAELNRQSKLKRDALKQKQEASKLLQKERLNAKHKETLAILRQEANQKLVEARRQVKKSHLKKEKELYKKQQETDLKMKEQLTKEKQDYIDKIKNRHKMTIQKEKEIHKQKLEAIKNKDQA